MTAAPGEPSVSGLFSRDMAQAGFHAMNRGSTTIEDALTLKPARTAKSPSAASKARTAELESRRPPRAADFRLAKTRRHFKRRPRAMRR
jgi:hypothetical protein